MIGWLHCCEQMAQDDIGAVGVRSVRCEWLWGVHFIYLLIVVHVVGQCQLRV